MEPIATKGTTLEVLAPYLPYGAPLATPKGPAKLVGINSGFFQCPVEIELVEDEQAGHLLSGRYNFDYAEVLPILRPFSQLCDPLPDGTVPAVEIGKEWARNSRAAEIVEDYEGYGESCVISGPGTTLSISRAAFESGSTADWLSKLLRKWHFAVGLAPHQYIEKPAPAATATEGRREGERG